MRKTVSQERREKIKAEFWPNDIAWTGDRPEVGWFRAPRTLPLILMLLSSKKVTDSKADLGSVYLELLTRHRDSGIVEMNTEADHSYAAGYPGARGIRTWHERMKLLEKLGLIKTKRGGNQTYKSVMLVHPAIAVKKLRDEGKVDETWWSTYRQMQIETKESSYDQLMERNQPQKVVPIRSIKQKTSKKAS